MEAILLMEISDEINSTFLLDSEVKNFDEKEIKRIVRNHYFLFMALSISVFLFFIYSFIYYKWFKFEVPSNVFWFHLFFVYESKENLKFSYSDFIYQICRKTPEINEKLGCPCYKIFEVSGYISGTFFILAFICNFVFILQLFLLRKNEMFFKKIKSLFKPKVLQLSAFLLNSIGEIFWITTCFLTEFKFFLIGGSFLIHFCSNFMAFLLCIYLRQLKKYYKTQTLIGDLLNPSLNSQMQKKEKEERLIVN